MSELVLGSGPDLPFREERSEDAEWLQLLKAQHGEDMVWEEQQRPCLESSAGAAEPRRLRSDELVLSRRGAHGITALQSIGKQHVSALGTGCL